MVPEVKPRQGVSRRGMLGAGLAAVTGVTAHQLTVGGASASADPVRHAATTGLAPIRLATIIADPGTFPGIDPTGGSDSTAGLQQAIQACADGDTLIVPAGRYRLDGTLTNGGKSLTLSGYGATLVKSPTARAMQLNGAYDDPVPVSAINDVVVSYGGDQQATRLSLPGLQPWLPGDVVKVVADDVIEGSRPGSGTDQSRVGQYFTVQSVANGSATLLGRRRISATVNIRVARLQRTRVIVQGFAFSIEEANRASHTGEICTMSGLFTPQATDLSFDHAGGPALVFRGCFGYLADRIVVRFAADEPAAGKFGYGILDNASSYGRIRDMNALHVRHAYTDDTSRVAPGSPVVHYGSTYGTIVSDSVCQGATTAAWDTHSCSEGVTFDRCFASASSRGFNLRGRKHTIRSSVVSGCRDGLRLTSEGTAEDESWGHTVSDVIVERATAGALIVDPFLGGGREARTSRVSGFLIRECSAPVVLVNNATLAIDGLTIDTGSLTDGVSLVRTNNSDVLARDWTIDFTQLTTGTGISLISARQSGRLDINGITVLWLPGGESRIQTVLESDRTVDVTVRRMTVPVRVGVSTDLKVGSAVEWTAGSDHSGYLDRRDAAIATASTAGAISRSTDRIIYADCRTTTNRNFADLLPGTVLGQLLIVGNSESSTGRVTVRNGPDRNTLLVDGQNVVLLPGRSLTLVWSGSIWRQI